MMKAITAHIPTSIAVIILIFMTCLIMYLSNEFIHKNRIRMPWALETNYEREEETDPLPTDAVLQSMSLGHLCDFFHGYIHSTQTLCSRRVRMGTIGDGGWDVCEDPRYKLDPANCLVYSFGIARDFSYDAAMQNYGCEVHSYDPSLGDYDPSEGQKFYFHKVGIGAKNSNKAGGWNIQTLGTAREMNHHAPSERRLDIVKMDVEGAELYSLMTAVDEGSLHDVNQLTFEIHLMFAGKQESGNPIKENLISILKLLRKLWHEGFRLYHTNRNITPSNIYTSAIEGKDRTLCYELYMIRRHQLGMTEK